MHPALLHAVVSRGSHLQNAAGLLSHQGLIQKSCTAVHLSHTFDHSCLEFKESHSSAKPDDRDRLKGFVLSLHEYTYFPINKMQAEKTDTHF